VRWVLKAFGKVPLRVILIIPFVTILFTMVGLTGWWTLRNGQQAVNDVASQLRSEITARIQERVITFLRTPHLVNQLNASTIQLGTLDLSNASQQERHFLQQTQTFQQIYSNYIGNNRGELYGAVRHLDGNLRIMRADTSTEHYLHYYSVAPNGQRGELLDSTSNQFDPRSRPWYKTAVQAGKPTWSDIYADFSTRELQITAVQPIFDEIKNLSGVLSSSLFFTQVNEFLRELKIGKTGQTFIMEHSGELVTTSTDTPVFYIENKQTERITALQSETPLIRQAAHYLKARFGNFEAITQIYQMDFRINEERQFLQVTPLHDEHGLDWLIVVVVPEKDFMERIHASTRTTIVLTLLSLLLASAIGIFTAQWITSPLLKLNRAAKALAQGYWEQSVHVAREDEVGELADSFNSMAAQLKKSFQTLRESENRLTQFLEAVPVGIGVLDADGKPYYYNLRAKEFLGEDIETAVSVEQVTETYKIYENNTNRLYPPQKQPIVRALHGESSTADDMEVHRRGKVVPLEVWGTPIFGDKGQVTYAIAAFQDITERKRAEAEKEKFTNELFELNRAYERFVSREFLNLLGKKSVIDVRLGDQVEREMTVMFSDIRGFTSLSETMTPQDNFKFINAYLSKMEPIIREKQGFIDKYIGDAIMALFPHSVDQALQAAIGMLKRLNQYNLTRGRPGRPILKIGIGVHTGVLMLGTVGGQNRMDGTVISDAVNVASRVEGLTKQYGVALLITEQTYQQLEDPELYKIRVIDRVQVKGKSKQLTVYEVYDADAPEILALKTQTSNDFAQGFEHYHHRQVEASRPFFEKVVKVNKHDEVAKVYLARCR